MPSDSLIPAGLLGSGSSSMIRSRTENCYLKKITTPACVLQDSITSLPESDSSGETKDADGKYVSGSFFSVWGQRPLPLRSSLE